MSGTLRARWRREVLRTPLVTDSVRVLLLAMCDDMIENAQVRMSRAVYATRLCRSERRISERLEQAVAAGLLDRVEKGAPGRLPLYAGLLAPPTGERVRAKSSRTWPTAGADVRRADGGHSPSVEEVPGVTDVRLADCSTPDRRTGVTPASRSEGGRPPGGRGSRISNHPLTAPRLVTVHGRQQERRNDEDRQPAYHPATPGWPAVRRAGGGA